MKLNLCAGDGRVTFRPDTLSGCNMIMMACNIALSGGKAETPVHCSCTVFHQCLCWKVHFADPKPDNARTHTPFYVTYCFGCFFDYLMTLF
jgi:hypothetical protein